MSVIIRKAVIGDLKVVQELNYKLFDLEYNNFDPALNMKWTFSEKGETYFKGLIKEGTVWVAVDNDKVIGYLAGSIDGKPSYATKTLAELDNFYIDNEYRRKGIGKKLVQEFEEYCINQDIEEIKVTASSKNINAREFYKNNGFDDFEVTYKMKLKERQKFLENIFILHSLNGDTLRIWGQDIKETYERKGINVIMPKFPIRAESKYEKFKNILKEYIDNGCLNKDSIIIAHSIGNAYFVRFCKELNYVPKVYIAVAPGACYEYPSSRNDYIVEVKKQSYLKEDSLDYVKNMNCIKYCLYSNEDDDNLEKFTRFINDTNSKGIYLKYYNHFDGYHRIYKIPELNDILNNII